jgi:hypothetical protein
LRKREQEVYIINSLASACCIQDSSSEEDQGQDQHRETEGKEEDLVDVIGAKDKETPSQR